MSLLNTWLQKKLANTRPALLAALEGNEPCDWRISGGNVLDVFTLTVYPADVWLKNGFIVAVQTPDQAQDKVFPGPLHAINVYSAGGLLIMPGYVDTHMHIESVEVTPYDFGIAAAPTGTTTVFTDCHEAVNVGGYEAFKYMLEDSESSPIRQFLLIPSCIPAVNGLETGGAEWFGPDIEKIYNLKHPRVAGAAEIMDYLGIIYGDRRMRDILEVTRHNDGFLQGHAYDMFGRSLASLRLHAVQSNHELYDSACILGAMKAGMYVDLSFVSSLADSSDSLREIMQHCIARIGSLDKLTFCTDDRNLAATLKEGRINIAISKFIAAARETGISRLSSDEFAYETVRAASLNAWREYAVENAGAVAPAYLADLQVVEPDLSFTGKPQAVFVDGQLVVDKGRLVKRPVKSDVSLDIEQHNTVKLAPITAEQLRIPVPAQAVQNGLVTVRVMDYSKGQIINFATTAELPVIDGYLSLGHRGDLTYVAVFHRHGRNHNIGFGIAKDLILKDGALATTVAHDGHNLVTVYRESTITLAVQAVNRLIAAGGGIVFYSSGGEEYLKPMPVWGLMSNAGIEETVRNINEFENNFKLHNGSASNPMIAALLSLTVAPRYRVTDLGLIDTLEKKVIPLFVTKYNEGEKS